MFLVGLVLFEINAVTCEHAYNRQPKKEIKRPPVCDENQRDFDTYFFIKLIAGNVLPSEIKVFNAKLMILVSKFR